MLNCTKLLDTGTACGTILSFISFEKNKYIVLKCQNKHRASYIISNLNENQKEIIHDMLANSKSTFKCSNRLTCLNTIDCFDKSTKQYNETLKAERLKEITVDTIINLCRKCNSEVKFNQFNKNNSVALICINGECRSITNYTIDKLHDNHKKIIHDTLAKSRSRFKECSDTECENKITCLTASVDKYNRGKLPIKNQSNQQLISSVESVRKPHNNTSQETDCEEPYSRSAYSIEQQNNNSSDNQQKSETNTVNIMNIMYMVE